MTFAVGIIIGTVGVVAVVLGLGYFAMFSIGSSIFEQALKGEAAEHGKAKVESAVWKISNLFLGKTLAEQLVAAGGDAALTRTRSILATRKRVGLLVAAAGVLAFVASFFTGSWLPAV
jgi:hypothetical protein